MRKNTGAVVVVACVLLAASAGRGGVIRLPATGGGHLISAHSPIGQSFTAEDPLVRIGLHIRPNSQNPNPDRNLLVQLFAGEGVGGPVLDARTVEPAAGFVGYLGVDYAHVPLAVGQKYSVTLSSTSSHWVSNSSSQSYAGGVAIITAVPRGELNDKAFEVVPIPEPTSLATALPAAGIAALLFRRRS